MKTQYLEIVTKDVDGVCSTYHAALNVTFGEPIATLGGARIATKSDGGIIGVRAPLRDSELPVVRPYWLVPDINVAIAAVLKAGGQLALPPMQLPGFGTCAIYLQGGNDHGLWQL
jgi:uncharacterized protein